MFNNLSDKLDKAFHILKGHGKITEVNVAETLKEVRRALLDADVNFKIAKDFTTKVKEKAIGQNVLTTLQPGQLLVKITPSKFNLSLKALAVFTASCPVMASTTNNVSCGLIAA